MFCVFLWKAYQTLPPCLNCPSGQAANLASIINKKTIILTERSPVATTVPSSGMNAVIGPLV